MTYTLHKICCRLLLVLLAVLLAESGAAFAIVAPDITSLTSISSPLNTPVRLTSDGTNLYVTDPRGGGIVKFDSAGVFSSKFSAAGKSLGIAVTAQGDLLVSQGTSVAVYSSIGVLKTSFGTFGRANGIAVSKNGTIFVADSLNNNVQVFNSSYKPAVIGASNSFGSAGSAPGQFFQPTGISYEKLSDQVAVVDTRNGRIQFFSTTGVYQKSIGSFGSGPLMFTSPQAVSFEYSSDQSTLNRIYVVDAFQSTIQIIDAVSGSFVRYIGGYGITEGKLITPSDILFGSNGQLVVANGTGKLSLFKVSDPSSGPFLQIDALPQATNLATLLISGTTTGTAVTVNGLPAQLSGTVWRATVSLVTGDNTFTVAATDAKGTTTKTISIAALAPAANPVILTVSPVVTQTADPILKLSGTVTSGGSVTVKGAAATVNGSVWSAAVSLSAGLNTISIVGSKAGMDNSTLDISVTLDTSMPVVATQLPSSWSVFSTPLQTISGSVTGNAGAVTVLVTLNGVSQPPVTVSDGVFSVPVLLAPGKSGSPANNITLTVVDSYGTTIQALARSLTYDPQAPRVTVTTPSAAVSGTPTYHLEGVAPAGSTVTVNGAAATVAGTLWSADVSLSQGMNGFEVKATPAAGGQTTTVMTEVTYAPGLPSLAITSPAKDAPVATSSYTLTGSAAPGTVVTARVNGVPTSVATSSTGIFSLTIPSMNIATGNYNVVVDVTDTTTGKTSTSNRTIVYDPVPPAITTTLAPSGAPAKVTAPGGVLVARDKNGPVGTVTVDAGGVATLDLTSVTYDAATLNIQSFSAAGLSSRNGDINLDGKVNIADALLALKVVIGTAPQPTFNQMLRADVGPVVNGEPTVDNRIKMSDLVVIIEKIIGLSSW